MLSMRFPSFDVPKFPGRNMLRGFAFSKCKKPLGADTCTFVTPLSEKPDEEWSSDMRRGKRKRKREKKEKRTRTSG